MKDFDVSDNNSAHSASESRSTSTSPAKLVANRANALKSTGPRTAVGKNHSRRNALKHGILSKRLLFSADGTPLEPELIELQEALPSTYDISDVRAHLASEHLLVEVWRSRQALAVELDAQKKWGIDGYFTSSYAPPIQRYATAARNAQCESLDILEEYRRPPAAATEIVDAESPADTDTQEPTTGVIGDSPADNALSSDSCDPATTTLEATTTERLQ